MPSTRANRQVATTRSRTGGFTQQGSALLAFMLFTAIPLARGVTCAVMTATAAVLFLWGWSHQYRSTVVISILAVVVGLCSMSGVNFPQLAFIVSTIAVALVVRKVGWMRGTFSWLQKGPEIQRVVPLSLAATALTVVGLAVWHSVAKPDNSRIYAEFGFLSLSLPMLTIGAVVFALSNAAIEEAIYRGLLMHVLSDLFPVPVALLLQAIAFGLLHALGFPGGAAGIVLATVYGAMMGALRLYSGGMLVPWVTHVAADWTIFSILLISLPSSSTIF